MTVLRLMYRSVVRRVLVRGELTDSFEVDLGQE